MKPRPVTHDRVSEVLVAAPRSTQRGFAVARDREGELRLEVFVDGDLLLRCPLTNKGTAFTRAERAELGLDSYIGTGLAAPAAETTLL
jgi:hypothetical protein